LMLLMLTGTFVMPGTTARSLVMLQTHFPLSPRTLRSALGLQFLVN